MPCSLRCITQGAGEWTITIYKTLENRALANVRPQVWDYARQQMQQYREMRVIH
jgi:hypothetical protein